MQGNLAVDRSIARTKELMEELPRYDKEMKEIIATQKLADRKLVVCNELLDEAEVHSER